MAWQTPKTDWTKEDVASTADLNRIEGNILELKKASTIDIQDTAGNFVANNVEDALQELAGNVKNGKTAIANAITAMGQSAAGTDTFDTLASKIRAISTDATATEVDVLSGKTFYAAGTKKTGSMPDNGAVIITPSAINQTIPRGYHDGNGYVRGVRYAHGSFAAKASYIGEYEGVRGAEISGKLYMCGGAGSGGGVNYTAAYDPITNTWTRKANVPSIVSSHGAAALNGEMYVVYGTYHYKYKPSTNTWTQLANPPQSVYSLASSNGKNYAPYVFGSTRYNYEYDPATNTWTAKAPPSINISTFPPNAPITTLNNLIYWMYGNSVEAYDPLTDTWESKASTVYGRAEGALVAPGNGKLYALCGSGNTISIYAGGSYWRIPTAYFSVEEYTPEANVWKVCGSIINGAQNVGYGAVNGKIYVIAGVREARSGSSGGLTYRREVTEYTPGTLQAI